MTTIPNPAKPTRVTADGTIQTTYSDAQVAEVIRRARRNAKNPNLKFHIMTARGTGTGTYGLYLEVVNETPGHEAHIRFFAVGDNLYAAQRGKGATRANWKHRKGGSLEKVLTFLDEMLVKPNIKLFGRAVLVELEADSVSQIEAGQMPAARFRGQYRTEKYFGKYDFDGGPLPESTVVWPADFPTPRVTV